MLVVLGGHDGIGAGLLLLGIDCDFDGHVNLLLNSIRTIGNGGGGGGT